MVQSLYILGNHIQALGVARMADRINLRVTLFSDYNASITRFSKSCHSFIKFHNEAHLFDLLNNQQTGNDKPVLVPTNDRWIFFIRQHYKSLSEKYLLSVPEPSILDICFNKRLTYQAAKQMGIPIPESYFPDSANELKGFAGKIDYPVIIKPAIMFSFFSKTGRKVYVCRNTDELESNYRLALNYIPPSEIIVQEFLGGGAQNLFSYGSFTIHGEPYGSFTANRIRQKPMDFGISTTFAKTVVIPELDKLAIKMLKGINYTGISEVEFMYDDTAGQYKMLEINPRTWKWHSLANIIGLNLIEQMVKYLDGLTPEPFMNKTENLAWIERLTDMWVFINEFFRGRMSVDEYIKSMRVKKESATWSKHDPWPAIFYILLSPYLFFKR